MTNKSQNPEINIYKYKIIVNISEEKVLKKFK